MLTRQQIRKYNALWYSLQRQLNQQQFVLWAARAANDTALYQATLNRIARIESAMQWIDDIASVHHEYKRLQSIAS